MKVAVLSDIHGNFQALESVMEDVKANNCEQVFCLGDLAMAGPQPRMVIDYVRKQNNWTVIQGNTDKMIADFSPEILQNVKNNFPVMANALADDVIFIEEDKKDYLRNLPAQKELTLEGVKLLLVHGSPRRNNEDILPDMPLKIIEEMLEGTNADLIFCGHTHVPAGYQTNKKQTVVNVGSAGRPMTEEPKACYVIADFQDGGFSIEHRFIDYDRQTAADIMSARNFDGADKLAQMILHPVSRHI
ncbi:MAG TPA: metallophosphoesterase family protein [Candidatus Stercorousia faecigallinarum]|nr:metallophosphoesterase family protein [Candidatus Stercorousia faecigallinarum]